MSDDKTVENINTRAAAQSTGGTNAVLSPNNSFKTNGFTAA